MPIFTSTSQFNLHFFGLQVEAGVQREITEEIYVSFASFIFDIIYVDMTLDVF